MKKETLNFTASDGTSLALHRWLPEDKPLGIIQIAHGMMEFAQRYDSFAEKAVKLGYAVIANDARGHGMTAGSLEALGRVNDLGSFVRCSEDLFEITLSVQKEWPGVPVILFGHSWGSFLSQMYIERHGDAIELCILSGTRGPDPFEVQGGKALTDLLCAAGNRNKRSALLFNMSFGACNAKIPKAKSPNAWLSTDEEEVQRYDDSPWCGFMPTTGFWNGLMTGLSEIHKKSAFASIPVDLPVLLFAGSGDPIGKYGKTINRLEKAYRERGMKDVERITYQGARHEPLNDTCREQVMNDMFTWIARRLKA